MTLPTPVVPLEQLTKMEATPSGSGDNSNKATTAWQGMWQTNSSFLVFHNSRLLWKGWQAFAGVNNWRALVPHCMRIDWRIWLWKYPCDIQRHDPTRNCLIWQMRKIWNQATHLGNSCYINRIQLLKENKKTLYNKLWQLYSMHLKTKLIGLQDFNIKKKKQNPVLILPAIWSTHFCKALNFLHQQCTWGHHAFSWARTNEQSRLPKVANHVDQGLWAICQSAASISTLLPKWRGGCHQEGRGQREVAHSW